MAVYQLPQTDVVGLIVAWAGKFGSRRFVDLANTVSWQDGLVAIFEGGPMETDRLTADVPEP
jgi:hypothetical protein